MMNETHKRPDLTEGEKAKPYAHFYDEELAPVPDDVLGDIESGPMDPRDALRLSMTALSA